MFWRNDDDSTRVARTSTETPPVASDGSGWTAITAEEYAQQEADNEAAWLASLDPVPTPFDDADEAAAYVALTASGVPAPIAERLVAETRTSSLPGGPLGG